MQERYIATVDLGSSKLALCVAKVTGDNIQILYYRERPSAGIRYSRVFNPKKAAAVLREAVDEAENELQIRISQVVTGYPRHYVAQFTADGELPKADRPRSIGEEDIRAIKSIALDTYPLDDPEREMLYGAVPQSFSADDFDGNEEDIIGVESTTLKAHYKVFAGLRKPVSNLDPMFNSAGISIANCLFLPVTTGDAVLKDDEKANGVGLLEVGAGVSSISIWLGGMLRFYASIPFGGKNITSDIKLECAFDERLAENIKLGFGACLPDKLQNMGDKILQINDEENGTYENLSVKYLSEIITARSREIVRAILYLIQESGFAERLRCGLVLTGGCADMANFAGLIKAESGYNVRKGIPVGRRFNAEGCAGVYNQSAAASVGMILACAADSHLNCTSADSLSEEETPSTTTENAPSATTENSPATTAATTPAKPEPTNDASGSDEGGGIGSNGRLFDDDQIDVVRPTGGSKTGRGGRTGGSGVRPPRTTKSSFIAIWKKGIGKVLNDSIGSLYDGMGENEN